jgi:hypothetical protein
VWKSNDREANGEAFVVSFVKTDVMEFEAQSTYCLGITKSQLL